MAFIRTDLALADAGQNSTLPRRSSYKSDDTDTVISTADYFLDAIDLLKVGDVINVGADLDGTPLYGRMLVLTNTGSAIDVADIEAFTVTDTE